MRKRRLGFILGLGLVGALFVSACGVALGPVQFTAGGPVVALPANITWHSLMGVPARSTSQGMLHAQNFIAPEVQLTGDGAAVHYCDELP